MRNLLAQGYRYADPSIVWQVAARDLPELETQIGEVLDDLTEDE